MPSASETQLGEIQAGDTRISISGNSAVTLSGSAGDLAVDASESSEVDLSEIPASVAGYHGDGTFL